MPVRNLLELEKWMRIPTMERPYRLMPRKSLQPIKLANRDR